MNLVYAGAGMLGGIDDQSPPSQKNLPANIERNRDQDFLRERIPL